MRESEKGAAERELREAKKEFARRGGPTLNHDGRKTRDEKKDHLFTHLRGLNWQLKWNVELEKCLGTWNSKLLTTRSSTGPSTGGPKDDIQIWITLHEN